MLKSFYYLQQAFRYSYSGSELLLFKGITSTSAWTHRLNRFLPVRHRAAGCIDPVTFRLYFILSFQVL